MIFTPQSRSLSSGARLSRELGCFSSKCYQFRSELDKTAPPSVIIIIIEGGSDRFASSNVFFCVTNCGKVWRATTGCGCRSALARAAAAFGAQARTAGPSAWLWQQCCTTRAARCTLSMALHGARSLPPGLGRRATRRSTTR